MDAYWNMHHKTRTRRHDKERPATSASQLFPRAEKLIAANRTKRAARREAARGPWRLRRQMKNEVNFPPKLRGARSRLYRRRFLQVNTRWKALDEIYTMHSFATFFNPKISAKIVNIFSRLKN